MWGPLFGRGWSIGLRWQSLLVLVHLGFCSHWLSLLVFVCLGCGGGCYVQRLLTLRLFLLSRPFHLLTAASPQLICKQAPGANLQPGSPLRSWPPVPMCFLLRFVCPFNFLLAIVRCEDYSSAGSSALVPSSDQTPSGACSSLEWEDRHSWILRVLVCTSLRVTDSVG